ncbi:Hypothetical predicted protein [Octopus vulgaris]|uniref:Uncharacterized protein n=1 Tax=Octopus vulgaris TaxID=6645 RepID=A0AA36FDH4_OCTVU|nr:Hypothetical predicted protein [Octopus vulgaris]
MGFQGSNDAGIVDDIAVVDCVVLVWCDSAGLQSSHVSAESVEVCALSMIKFGRMKINKRSNPAGIYFIVSYTVVDIESAY